jgi:hypothetical protein
MEGDPPPDGQTASPDESLEKVAAYTISRKKATLFAVAMGILLGVLNSFLDIDLSLRVSLLFWLVAAVLVVVFLHEGIHGAAAMLLGQRPIFGFKPPLVFTTFREKIPRDRLILIALAPLILLDIVFGVLFALGVLEVFAILCFSINTLGATGDLWIVSKILRHGRESLIQDTKTGVEVWREKTPEPA